MRDDNSLGPEHGETVSGSSIREWFKGDSEETFQWYIANRLARASILIYVVPVFSYFSILMLVLAETSSWFVFFAFAFFDVALCAVIYDSIRLGRDLRNSAEAFWEFQTGDIHLGGPADLFKNAVHLHNGLPKEAPEMGDGRTLDRLLYALFQLVIGVTLALILLYTFGEIIGIESIGDVPLRHTNSVSTITTMASPIFGPMVALITLGVVIISNNVRDAVVLLSLVLVPSIYIGPAARNFMRIFEEGSVDIINRLSNIIDWRYGVILSAIIWLLSTILFLLIVVWGLMTLTGPVHL